MGYMHARSIRDKVKGNLLVFERGDENTGLIRLFTIEKCNFDSFSKDEVISSSFDTTFMADTLFEKLKIKIYVGYNAKSDNKLLKFIFEGTVSGFDAIIVTYSFSNTDFTPSNMDDIY